MVFGRNPLSDFSTDVAIIGGGLTGLLTAIHIKKTTPGTSVRLLEQAAYPAGASVKNAGFACYGSASEILDDIENEGASVAIARVISRCEGLQMLRNITGDKNIDWRTNDGYEVFTNAKDPHYLQATDRLPELNEALANTLGFTPFTLVPNSYKMRCAENLIKMAREASIDSGKTLKVLLDIARSLKVEMTYGSAVESFSREGDHWRISLPGGNVKAGKLVITTNAFSAKFLPDLPLLPFRGQVLHTTAIKGLQLHGNFHLNQGYYYFRSYRGGVLLGGGRHIDKVNEQTSSQQTTEKIQNNLEQLLRGGHHTRPSL
ncbi:MAG: FAD-dependent oxidoreductase [Owenweeksia sp.]|nr:FAD-dependent oxidoreductase [Owenweeksia sp.]